jgi:hypothetical protein
MAYPRNPIYEKAYELYQEGKSLSEVAKLIGVTRQSVYKCFKARDFKCRPTNLRQFQMFDSKKFTLRDTGYYSLSNGGRYLMHRYVWEYFNGAIPSDYDVHHIDEDRSNNSISNLECLPKADHTRLHHFKRKKEAGNAAH